MLKSEYFHGSQRIFGYSANDAACTTSGKDHRNNQHQHIFSWNSQQICINNQTPTMNGYRISTVHTFNDEITR